MTTDTPTETLPLQVLRGSLARLAVGAGDDTVCVSPGTTVHRRTAAQASIVRPPLGCAKKSNHTSTRMESPFFALTDLHLTQIGRTEGKLWCDPAQTWPRPP